MSQRHLDDDFRYALSAKASCGDQTVGIRQPRAACVQVVMQEQFLIFSS
jgi:hypothetical protein